MLVCAARAMPFHPIRAITTSAFGAAVALALTLLLVCGISSTEARAVLGQRGGLARLQPGGVAGRDTSSPCPGVVRPGEDGTARWCATERFRPCPKNARALEVDDDGIGELRRQLARGYDVMLVGGAFQAARARTHTHTLAPRTDIHGGSQTRSRANGSRRSRAICR